MTKTSFVLSALAVGLALSIPLAQAAKGGSKAVEYRHGIMSIYKWNLDPLGAMAKGDQPFDKARFAALAQDLNRAAQLDLLSGFPRGSNQGNTEAKAEIWKDWDGFKGHFNDFQKAAGELAATAEGGDLEAIKPKFAAASKTCKSCHEKYRKD